MNDFSALNEAVCKLLTDIQTALKTTKSGTELVEHAKKCAEAYEYVEYLASLNKIQPRERVYRESMF